MNAFQVLGLRASATSTEIKAAYRKLAQINHPDRCAAPGATAALSAINVAYQYLTKGGRRSPEFPDTIVIFRSAEECAKAADQAAAPKGEGRVKKTFKRPSADSDSGKLWALFDTLPEGTTRADAAIWAKGYNFSDVAFRHAWHRWNNRSE